MQKVEKRTSSLPSPSRFLGLIVLWLFFGIIFILYTWHNYAWLQRGSSDLFKLWDFKLFYGGSLDFFQGGSPYTQTATLPFERVLDKNGNSPLGAVAFLVLAQLPLMLAAAVWMLLSLALLYWGLSYIWKVYPPSARWHWRGALLLFVYISFPVVDTIQLGSWGMIIAFLDFAAWYYARKGNEGRAGIFLGIAIALRWQPAIIFLYFLLVFSQGNFAKLSQSW